MCLADLAIRSSCNSPLFFKRKEMCARGKQRKKLQKIFAKNLSVREGVTCYESQSQEKRRRSERQRKQKNLDLKKSCCSSRSTSDVNTSSTSKRKKTANASRKKRPNKKAQQSSKRQKVSASFFDDIQQGYPNNKKNHYVEKILGCTEKNGKRYVIVKWKNVDNPTVIDESRINEYIKNLVVFHHLKEITRMKKKGRARSKPTGRSCVGSEIPMKTESSSARDYRSKQSKVFEKEILADRRVDIKIEND
ncbi:heterochromatin protein 1-like isoform X4 [Stegodyphus dumicola]|uniref:heterochromatin protein 1-like isoform X4 n=1 Tax=Stegodyphus dumicola TaxID=202533 RepID=UPI0015A9459A|nr:heterochromatin protein 1-like isoform X4 [Stegodyphus dumicola]